MPIRAVKNRATPAETDQRVPDATTRIRPALGHQTPAPSTSMPAPVIEEKPVGDSKVDYEVGYRKPPRHAQFKPGRSGNPRGRPKAAKGLHSIVRDTLTQKVSVRTASGTKQISRIEAVLQKTVEQAMKGNPRALAELIKLYANAVPEVDQDQKDNAQEEDLTATDLATLEELRRMLTGGDEEEQP